MSRKEYDLARYKRLRREYVALLGGTCAQCGSGEDLEFDHIDPTSKEHDVSKIMLHGRNKVLGELSKCQLLCFECHLEKSRGEASAKPAHNRIVNPEHGTWAMYANRKCRCELCRGWRIAYRDPATRVKQYTGL